MSTLTVAQRAVGAVVGNIIADAAAVPVHWVYNDEKLKEVLAAFPQPEFIPKSHSPFYTVPTGRNGANGEMAFVLLESLVACEGFNREDYSSRLVKFFGDDSDYNTKLGRPITKEDMPIPGPWRPMAIKGLLGLSAKPEQGDADVFGKVAPLVALYAGSPKLAETVEEMTRLLQDNDLSVTCAHAAAALLEQYVLNGTDPDTISKVTAQLDGEVVSYMKEALAAVGRNHTEVVAQFGKICNLPGSFKNAVHCIAESDGDFVATIRKDIVAGGDNVPRCAFIGACMGAQVGLPGLPSEWIKKTKCAPEVISLSERLVAMRK